jgi:hypothetical protein
MRRLESISRPLTRNAPSTFSRTSTLILDALKSATPPFSISSNLTASCCSLACSQHGNCTEMPNPAHSACGHRDTLGPGASSVTTSPKKLGYGSSPHAIVISEDGHLGGRTLYLTPACASRLLLRSPCRRECSHAHVGDAVPVVRSRGLPTS